MILNMVGGGGSTTKSTIIVSVTAGSTVAAYSDSGYTTLVKTATEKSSGEFWLIGLDNGTYYIKATLNGDEATTSYTISEYGVYRITMNYWAATIAVSFSTDATSLTCSDGVTTYTATESLSSGSYTFTVSNAGEWAIVASNTNDSISVSVNVTAQTAYSATLPSLVPNTYQVVEYIQSSGSQYIDTTVSGGSSFAYEIKFNPLGTTATSFEQYFAGAASSYPKLFYDNASPTGITASIGSSAADTYHLCPLANADMVITYDGTDLYLDGVQAVTITNNIGWGSQTWYVFNSHGENTLKSSMRLYYLKMYKDDNLVRYFAPCYRISDNKAGLWDRVGNTFYTNSGSGTFIVGGAA